MIEIGLYLKSAENVTGVRAFKTH